MMPAGSINTWTCTKCGHETVAVHVADGTTPMSITCTATGCNRPARTAGYREPARQVIARRAVTHEWYHPTEKWARRYGPDMERHVAAGGLVLCPITDLGRRILTDLYGNKAVT